MVDLKLEPEAPPSGPGEAEASRLSDQRLQELQERFVLHWGEMADAWGINRTMGQIHALLYIHPAPLSAEEIMERLKISRGNASMNLRSLEDWGLIQRIHYTGDRREYFKSLTDVWEMCRTVVQERKRREFDPTLRSLRQFIDEAHSAQRVEGETPGIALYSDRLTALLNLLQLLDRACERVLPANRNDLPRLLEVDVAGLE